MSTASLLVTPQRPARGRLQGPLPAPFRTQSFTMTSPWGAAPGEARVIYVTAGAGAVAVPAGAELVITGHGHSFSGVCVSDRVHGGTDGHTRELVFQDFRFYLDKDWITAAFNLVDERIVDGRVTRRYQHQFPEHFNSGRRTFTRAPLSAREVLDKLFNFNRRNFRDSHTVETLWRRNYHPALALPVLDLDFTSPRTLGSCVTEICEKLGLTFGLVEGTGPLTLTFVRKGEGSLPTFDLGEGVRSVFPPKSDHRNRGGALSGAPTRVRLVGDRNRYQVMNVALEPDWAPAWERFLDLAEFEDDLFRRASDETGVRLNAPREGDPEAFWGRFRAAELARTITVAQYAELRRRVPLDGDAPGQDFTDVRKYAGRSRMEMPAALYLGSLLFRAFRPVLPLHFPNASGEQVPLEAMQLEARLLAPVTHDPVTGALRLDERDTHDGNGYAIAQGHRVGADGFVNVRPADFDFAEWSRIENLWQQIPFHPDETGEGVPFVLFDEPVVRAQNLVEVQNGYAALRADGTLVAPPVRAVLVFAAERFNYVRGSGGYDHAQSVAGLNGEFITEANGGGAVVELPFADGGLAGDKADLIARSLLSRPWYYEEGGFTYRGSLPARLNSMWDRIQFSADTNGVTEQVDFTKERNADSFEPTVVLTRRRQLEALLPGQEELRQQARETRALAAQFRGDARLRRTLSQALRGTDEPPVFLTGLPPGTVATLPVGTPLWTAQDAPRQGAAFVPGAEHVVFAGVTARHNESPARGVSVHRAGDALVRVQGPVEPNDLVGRAEDTAAGSHLVKDGSVAVGRVRARIAEAEVKLVPVTIGAGGGAAAGEHPFQVVLASSGAADPGGSGGSGGSGGDGFIFVGEGVDERIPRVRVLQGQLHLGLDYLERAEIRGLGDAFPLRSGDKVWLELWFDVGTTGDTRPPLAAGVCRGPAWNGSPKAVEVVTSATKPAEAVVDALIRQQWAVTSAAAGSIATALKESLARFPAAAGVRRHLRTFVLLGYTTAAAGAKGLALSGIQTDEQGEPVLVDGAAVPLNYTFVQCAKTHLLLAGFCENGVPVRFPVPLWEGLPA